VGLENVAPDCNGGKRRTGTCGKRHCMEHRVFIMSAQSCKMRPLSAFKRDCSCTKCLSDRGQLTMIAAMSSNQAYAAQSSSLHRVLFAAIVAAVTGLIEIRWSGCGPHLVSQYSQFIVWQIQTQMTTTKSTTTATATSDQPQSAVSEPQSQDLREVCLVQQRDARLSFVPCGHQRFCDSCVAQLKQQARGCPICRTDVISGVARGGGWGFNPPFASKPFFSQP